MNLRIVCSKYPILFLYMRKTVLLFAAAVAVLSGCKNVDYSVWNEPFADNNPWTGARGSELIISKVVFGDDETTLYMTVKGYPGEGYTYAKETYLQADGKSYPMQSVDGLVPGQFKIMGKSRTDSIVFHFEPLPKDTKSFDIIEGRMPGAFNIFGIHQFDANSLKIAGTQWRNARTGDWAMSILDTLVMYDCRIWKIESMDESGLTMNCEGKTAEVRFSNPKNGIRKITVNGKSFKGERFEGNFLPAYPSRGRHSVRIKDYGYDKADSVTVYGYIDKQHDMEMSATVDYSDALTGDVPTFPFTVNSDGHFSVTFPILNTSTMVMRGNLSLSFPVEPGHSYFVYHSPVYDRTFVMGESTRLQNEFNSNDVYVRYDRIEDSDYSSDMKGYLDYLKSTRDNHFAKLDKERQALNLSDALVSYSQAYANLKLYGMIGQARFHNEAELYKIPDYMLEFIRTDMQDHSIKPYSLFYEFAHFIRDFSESLGDMVGNTTIRMTDVIEFAKQNGMIEISESDERLLVWSDSISALAQKIHMEYEDDNERAQALANLLADNADTLQQLQDLIERLSINDLMNNYASVVMSEREFNDLVTALDSMNLDKPFTDFIISHYFASKLTNNRHSVPSSLLAKYDSLVSLAPAKDKVHKLNEKFLALENADLGSLGGNVTPEQLANMSDGESILRKLTEPYLGRIVYIDIWGSWCHPCLENLSKAHELKEQLKDYDIVYLYLASSTSDSSWKGVIKEYNLTGEDCVHYNLPPREQELIEQFLDVHSFPSYFLLNRHGALIDGNFHPSNISALKATLDKL